jgi:hypothetical protein
MSFRPPHFRAQTIAPARRRKTTYGGAAEEHQKTHKTAHPSQQHRPALSYRKNGSVILFAGVVYGA